MLSNYCCFYFLCSLLDPAYVFLNLYKILYILLTLLIRLYLDLLLLSHRKSVFLFGFLIVRLLLTVGLGAFSFLWDTVILFG